MTGGAGMARSRRVLTGNATADAERVPQRVGPGVHLDGAVEGELRLDACAEDMQASVRHREAGGATRDGARQSYLPCLRHGQNRRIFVVQSAGPARGEEADGVSTKRACHAETQRK